MDQGLPQGLPHQYFENIELFYLFTLLTDILESGSEVMQTSVGTGVLQNCGGRMFSCIQLFDICNIFIQAFISRFINVEFLISEPLL